MLREATAGVGGKIRGMCRACRMLRRPHETERTFHPQAHKIDFLLKKSPHILLPNFQAVLFFLLRVSEREIGLIKKTALMLALHKCRSEVS